MVIPSNKSVTVSAPGKMLLAGGYLVLERPNDGFVVAADKRFYTTVASATPGVSRGDNLIQVSSPQFHSKWIYEYDPSNSNVQPAVSNTSINPFVEKALRVCFLYLLEPGKEDNVSLDITIQADNDFYSILPHLPEGQARTPETVQTLGKFLKCPKDSDGRPIVNKTGLGSSAALTTSLVGALVHYFKTSVDNTDEEKEDTLTTIHNLAQICHCHAQGKVGSGFDVSAACHGTHVYRRFAKCILPDLLGQLEHEESMGGTNARSTLEKLAEPLPWQDDMVSKLILPKRQLQVLLADVRGGSESPSMAKTVLRWKQSKAADPPILHWDDLATLNKNVVDIVASLNQPNSQVDYDALATVSPDEWPEDSPLQQLRRTFGQIRRHLKELGNDAGVPIEPDEQTKLCNATSKVPGVVTCLVPGAGGYDAVVCLYIDRPSVQKAIGDVWASWKSPIICPLGVQASDDGLRFESDFSALH